MASTGAIFQNALYPSLHSSSTSCKNQTLFSLNPSQFISSKSLLKLKKQSLGSSIRIKQLKNYNTTHVVYAAQSNFFKVIQTVWKVGKDGVEVGTNLVPDSIPRPIARIAVTTVAVTLALFVLKSFISAAFFALAVIGLSYFTFIALNKDDGSKGGGEGTTSLDDDDSLEEARRIMEKYK